MCVNFEASCESLRELGLKREVNQLRSTILNQCDTKKGRTVNKWQSTTSLFAYVSILSSLCHVSRQFFLYFFYFFQTHFCSVNQSIDKFPGLTLFCYVLHSACFFLCWVFICEQIDAKLSVEVHRFKILVWSIFLKFSNAFVAIFF